MIEYFNQYTINDFISIYCFGMLGMILMVVSMGLLAVVTFHAMDVINVFWYEMKTKRTKYQRIIESSRSNI